MASILRQIVAGPRARHPEANLDLCYVTDNIIATSGPSGTYPQLAYRNPLSSLVKFLDAKHGTNWAIWEFRAEGTGYSDAEVYGRINHYPWPDHHPPPFGLVPPIMGSMKAWLQGGEGRVVVVHCKAGKGRSGTSAISYLISEEGWTPADAMQRFTDRRMRPGFGVGISIPSQRRWIGYVDRWTKGGKLYTERKVEVLEVHVWGLRDGVKIAVEGFEENGKVIKTFHTFSSAEREIVRGGIRTESGFADVAAEVMKKKKINSLPPVDSAASTTPADDDDDVHSGIDRADSSALVNPTGGDVVFRPSKPIILPTSDINIDLERRNKTKYGGFTMVTSVAHVWFNTFFEGNGPEQSGTADDSGVFEIDFDAMDGIKGSAKKGTRACDRIAVLWKVVGAEGEAATNGDRKHAGDGLQETADAKALGLRPAQTDSASISRASSVKTSGSALQNDASVPDEIDTVKAHGPPGDEDLKDADRQDGDVAASPLSQSQVVPGGTEGSVHALTERLQQGVVMGKPL